MLYFCNVTVIYSANPWSDLDSASAGTKKRLFFAKTVFFSHCIVLNTQSFTVFIVGNFTTAILYLTVTCYKLLLAGFLKSPIFHNLL